MKTYLFNSVKMAICLKVTKEPKQWSRQNGWSLPLHPLQILAWFFLLMFAVLYFGVLVPNMPVGAWRISAYVINGFIFLFHIVIHFISVSLNPADVNVRAKAVNGPLPSFDRSKHSHVIENEYCHICEVKVGRKSKHCSACNKCVSEFDHHCKWLNNCVGGRNYRLFICCISSALLGSLIIFVCSLVLIVAYFEKAIWLFCPQYNISNLLHTTTNYMETNTTELLISPSTFGDSSLSETPTLPPPNITLSDDLIFLNFQIQGTIWICLIFITAALSLLAIALLGHLLGFHIFLMCQNFSTYDYIVHKRDPAASSGNRSEKNKPNPFLPKCPIHLFRIKNKKGNQISPKAQENGKSDEAEEWEMQTNIQHGPPDNKKPSLPIVTENKCAGTNEEEECPLEKYIGNVYIGSPHRRRHYLEPLHVRQKGSSPKNKPGGKKEGSPLKKEKILEETDKEEENATDNDRDDSSCTSSPGQSYSHNLGRRHLRTPSPAPLLSPILESEISSGSAIVSWKHRSVSEQSLHTLDESEEETAATSTTCTVQIEPSTSLGMNNREDSGSLSNLFLSKDQLEETEEDNNNILIDDDNRVHEVCIIPQSAIETYESNHNVTDSQDIIENSDRSNDPLTNGEVWAFASRNGCQVRDGIVSFRRSCSMQDNERLKNASADPLTRCCSEDELKSAQRMTKLQRRLSEDRDLWMLRGSNSVHNPWKEISPKAGISATAVFCVEEPDESFKIPGIPFGLKRKYNHFSVPNHIVLPCSNSVHPESRKRTRPVGSKPPKAFHA